MAASKFTAETKASLIARVRAGCSTQDAARAAGVSRRTVAVWITKGNKGQAGYAEFVAELEAARSEAANRPEPMTAEELRLVVSEAARNGSVQAMKLLDEMQQRDHTPEEHEVEVPTDPLAGVDELAARRAA